MVADPRLVIVRRGHFATFELLARTFADDESVKIIWDRRISERRIGSQSAGDGERRRTDRRRMASTQWGMLDYMVAGNKGVGVGSV
jgi:hypothetical protein